MPLSNSLVGMLRGVHRDIDHEVIPIFSSESVLIGTSEFNNVQLKHPSISYLHAEIYTVKSGEQAIPFIRDTSENGTYINHQRIGRQRAAALFQGCVISFASSDFGFYYIPNIEETSSAYAHKDHAEFCEEIKVDFNIRRQISHGQTNENDLQREIVRLTDVIGSGGEGTVYLAIPKDAQAYPMACKIGRSKFKDQFQRDGDVMDSCQHANILPLLHRYESEDSTITPYLLTPLASGGDLYTRINYWMNEQKLNESTARCIFYQLVMGVNYLHRNTEKPIIHGDLKPHNILLYDNSAHPWVAICDFGSAFYNGDELYKAPGRGTPEYSSPELLKGEVEKYGEKIDIWALGLILYEMLGGYHPFLKKDQAGTEYAIKNEEPDFRRSAWKSVDQKAKDLIRWLLSKDPDARPTIDDLLDMGKPGDNRVRWIYEGCDMERYGQILEKFRAETAIWCGARRTDSDRVTTVPLKVDKPDDLISTTRRPDQQHIDKVYQRLLKEMTRKEGKYPYVRPGFFPHETLRPSI